MSMQNTIVKFREISLKNAMRRKLKCDNERLQEDKDKYLTNLTMLKNCDNILMITTNL